VQRHLGSAVAADEVLKHAPRACAALGLRPDRAHGRRAAVEHTRVGLLAHGERTHVVADERLKLRTKGPGEA